jgi:hypothetical protein
MILTVVFPKTASVRIALAVCFEETARASRVLLVFPDGAEAKLPQGFR